MKALYTLNSEKNGIEILFSEKPSLETRGALKNHGFRWHKKRGIWYAKQTDDRLSFAQQIARGEEVEADVIGGELSPGYMGVERWDGYKSGKHLYGAELSKAIRSDIKAHGIRGASVRVHTFSMGQSITVTIKATEEDFIPYEEWKEGQNIYDVACCGVIFTSENEQVVTDEYFTLSDAEQERVFELNAKRAYYSERDSQAWQYTERFTTPTPDFRAKIEKVNAIICTYRYDDSNSMVDYFDTNFYYDIQVKMS